jgi:type IV pilus assembly protein PilY1
MTKLLQLMKTSIVVALCISFGIPITADDTEIYQAVFNPTDSSSRPKVLIIFDNSGSMGTNVTSQLADYDPNTIYADQGYDGTKIYWSLTDTSRWFLTTSNRCAESIVPLATTGQFSGIVQAWRPRSGSNDWRNVGDNDSTRNSDHIDCLADQTEDNQLNPGTPIQANGYPSEITGPYTADDKTLNWGTSNRTFYSANYMNYYHDSANTITKTRTAIAKEVVTDIIGSNPAIDFGLLTFNRNTDEVNGGGRVIKHLTTDMTDAERTALINTVDALPRSLYTPLCETSYEVYRYLTGSSVEYGAQQEERDSPDRDMNAETALIYNSPTTDCAYTYVILMTDGTPVRDTGANDEIELLTGHACTGSGGSCLPDIAEYMATTDLDGDDTNGEQLAYTYTIGFATDQVLLQQTADKGQGEYYTADDSAELAVAFRGAISAILETDSSFTSPAVAVDTFSRTESRNEVFFAMFKPSQEIDWNGNIKRLDIVLQSGIALLKDANGDNAFEVCPGNVAGDITECIASDAQTVWSTTNDGGTVEAGGVGALLVSRNLATNARVLYSNTGASNALRDFDDAYSNRTNSGYATDADLFSDFDVANQTELTELLSWARGIDVDDKDEDGQINDVREWIMSDMLHSRPIVVNYGARGTATQANPDQRIVVGTNGGFLHMFDVDDGQEDWAFFPKELSSIIQQRRTNIRSNTHVYGIDAPPVLYVDDINKDGTIDSTAGDKAFIYTGLRRGGSAMYAMDISNPDTPEFKWRIDQSTTGFSELGQTWSVPAITTIPGYTYDHDADIITAEIPKPVLIFGAGYDTNKDAIGLGTTDSMGRGIYIIDAYTGALIWGITPGANSATNMQKTELQHSVPAIVTPFDSNGDGVSDRIYFADTGGNLWRVDMPGLVNNARPTASQTSWFLTKMASVNGGTDATDRRFFAAPDVVRTKKKVCVAYYPAPNADKCKLLSTINYDAVLIGTGDRTNPIASDVENQFYMFRDLGISPFTMAPQTSTQCNNVQTPPLAYDFRCELNSGAGLSPTDLFDVTSNVLQTGTDSEIAVASSALESANGWVLNLGFSGEKSLARALTLSGTVYFTTFAPETDTGLSCQPIPGLGRLYRVDIHSATEVNIPNNVGTYDRSIELGSLVPDTPSPHFGSDDKVRLLFPAGGGPQALDTNTTMPQPYGIYWYREEL